MVYVFDGEKVTMRNPYTSGTMVVYMPNAGNDFGFLHEIEAGLKTRPGEKVGTVLLKGVRGEVPVTKIRLATLCEIRNGKANNDDL